MIRFYTYGGNGPSFKGDDKLYQALFAIDLLIVKHANAPSKKNLSKPRLRLRIERRFEGGVRGLTPPFPKGILSNKA